MEENFIMENAYVKMSEVIRLLNAEDIFRKTGNVEYMPMFFKAYWCTELEEHLLNLLIEVRDSGKLVKALGEITNPLLYNRISSDLLQIFKTYERIDNFLEGKYSGRD